MAGVTTSVRIDIDLYMKVQEKGLNVSDITNRALREILGDDDLTEAQLKQLLEERSRVVQGKVRASVESHLDRKSAALKTLQEKWNLYLSSGPKPDDAKVAWINAHRGRSEALAGMTAAEILNELEGPG